MRKKIEGRLAEIPQLRPDLLGDLACRWDIGPAALKPMLLRELSCREQLYFSFGSNMSLTRLQKTNRAPDCQTIGPAKLNNYRLVFNIAGLRGTQSEGGAVANLEPYLGEILWGVLYWLPVDQIAQLTAVQSHYGYQVHFEAVEAQHIGPLKAYFYMAREKRDHESTPSPTYLNWLLEGAKQLPKSYRAHLKKKLHSLAKDTGPPVC